MMPRVAARVRTPAGTAFMFAAVSVVGASFLSIGNRADLVAPARAEEATQEPRKPQEDVRVIQEGSTVSIEYKLTLDDGTEVDTNVGKDPLVYQQGQGQIIPGLEREMVGLHSGDSKTVKVSVQDGYGEIDPDAFREVASEQVPEDARKEGSLLMAQGHNAPIRVHEVREDTIVLDFNHPLAGQSLNFDVKVISVE